MAGLLTNRQLWRRQNSPYRNMEIKDKISENTSSGPARAASHGSFNTKSSKDRYCLQERPFATTGNMQDIVGSFRNRTQTTTKKSATPRVSFSPVVRVVLIPTVDEYIAANLFHDLWWTCEDTQGFRRSAVDQLRHVKRNPTEALKCGVCEKSLKDWWNYEPRVEFLEERPSSPTRLANAPILSIQAPSTSPCPPPPPAAGRSTVSVGSSIRSSTSTSSSTSTDTALSPASVAQTAEERKIFRRDSAQAAAAAARAKLLMSSHASAAGAGNAGSGCASMTNPISGSNAGVPGTSSSIPPLMVRGFVPNILVQ